MNPPAAIAELHRLAKAGEGAALTASARMLGLLEPGMGDWAASASDAAHGDDPVAALLAPLLARWQAARAAKDFAAADALRAALGEAGIAVRNLPDGGIEGDRLPHMSYDSVKAVADRFAEDAT